jgi:hypothetical protein
MNKVVWGRSVGWNLENQGMQVTQIITDGCDCYPWHEVYAWWPVKTITGNYVWGRRIYKRKVWLVWGGSFHMEPETQYAEFFEILKDGDITN